MSITKYLKETREELKEVKFPSMSQTITFTALVVLISIIVAVVLGGVDFGLKNLVERILG